MISSKHLYKCPQFFVTKFFALCFNSGIKSIFSQLTSEKLIELDLHSLLRNELHLGELVERTLHYHLFLTRLVGRECVKRFGFATIRMETGHCLGELVCLF